MKKIISTTLSALLVSYALTACSPQTSNMQDIQETQNISAQANEDIDIDLFNALDSNQNGGVSFSELKVFLDVVATEVQNKDNFIKACQTAFNTSDLSKNGEIEKSEFKGFQTELAKVAGPSKNSAKQPQTTDPKVIKMIFNSLKDSKDSMSEKAFTKLKIKKLTSAQLQEVFKVLDKNNNKSLDYNEFSAIYTGKNSFSDAISGIKGAVAIVLALPVLLLLKLFGSNTMW
ncbi:MAG: EF-hand domain-containing protein [Candidatus Sericytochromatia bacterium]